MLDRKLLGIYLNDHLAGSTVGMELSRRAAGSNKGSAYGDVLERVAREIEEDRETLKGLMDRLEIRHGRAKVAAGWVGEKFGRLKPNGRLLSYSPLSRLVELESLALGIAGKLSLWEALKEVAAEDARLDAEELGRLADRAERQRKEVWQLRQRAAREAFVPQARVT
jgi:hypothetical protein